MIAGARRERRSAARPLWLERLGPAGAVLAAELLAIWPLLRPGLPELADLLLHQVRAVELDSLLRAGWLYPRWAPDLAHGYGFPIFNYYAPLGSYLVVALHRLGLDLPLATKTAFLGVYLAYGPSMYGFARRFLPPGPATVAAVAYAWVPFRFRELYVQGDYPQLLAFALAPLAFAAVHDLALNPTPRRFGLAVLATSALLLSHNISALNAGLFLALYALVLLVLGERHGRPLGRLGPLVLAAGATLALTAFFWLPALAERGLVQLDRLLSGDFHFSRHFPAPLELLLPSPVVDRAAANPPVPHNLGVAHLALSALTLAALPSWRRLGPAARAHLAFGWLALLLAVFLMLPVSTPVWERAPLLAFTEYPWRFRLLAALATSVLAGLAASWAGERAGRAAGPVFLGLLLALVLPQLVHLYPREPFAPYDVRTVADVARFEREHGAVGTTSAGEYYPVWVVEPPGPRPNAGRLEPSSLPPGASARLLEREPLRQRYAVELPTPARLVWNLLFFPGWQARVDGQPVPIEPVGPHGLIGLEAPAGAHEIVLSFEGTPLRTGAELLSGLSALGLAFGLAGFRALGRRGHGRVRTTAPADGHEEGTAWSPGPSPAAQRASGGEAGRPGGWGLGAALAFAALLLLKAAVLDPLQLLSYASPPGTVRGVQRPADVVLGGRVRFLGYDLAAETVAPGGELRVTVYWQALEPLDRSYHSFVKLLRRSTGAAVAGSDHVHPGGIPAWSWSTNGYVRDEHLLRLPPDTPPQGYLLVAGLYEQPGFRALRRPDVAGPDGDLLPLQTVVVRADRPTAAGFTPLEARFGGGITLLGYRIEPAAARPGATVQLALRWRAERPVGADYTVFVHLLDQDGRLVAQGDGPPLQGDYPTSEWLVGDPVEDRHAVRLPPDLSPGPYRFLVGLYHPQTLERLALAALSGERISELLLDAPLLVQR